MSLNYETIKKELQVVLKCAKVELQKHEVDDLRALLSPDISSDINWNLLLEFSTFHRLVPLVYSHLRKSGADIIPADILQKFKLSYEESVRRNLAQTAELKRLVSELNKAKIDISIIKGHALKKTLYGNISLRDSYDIDMLVRQSDVIKVSAIVKRLGFLAHDLVPDFDMGSTIGRRMIRERHEQHFESESSGVSLDLHWRLSHSFYAFPIQMETLWDEAEETSSEFGLTRQLRPSAHFVYLCYHGSKHCWYRLHWLCDIALLISQNKLDWEDVLSRAQHLGILPAIELAVVLSNFLLKVPIPETLKDQSELLENGRNLAQIMLPTITQDPEELAQLVIPSRIYTEWRFQTRWPHRFLVWTDLLSPSNKDYRLLKLPQSLSFLYYLVRLMRLSVKLAFHPPSLLMKRLLHRH